MTSDQQRVEEIRELVTDITWSTGIDRRDVELLLSQLDAAQEAYRKLEEVRIVIKKSRYIGKLEQRVRELEAALRSARKGEWIPGEWDAILNHTPTPERKESAAETLKRLGFEPLSDKQKKQNLDDNLEAT